MEQLEVLEARMTFPLSSRSLVRDSMERLEPSMMEETKVSVSTASEAEPLQVQMVPWGLRMTGVMMVWLILSKP
jgi:hypothetical protein